MIGHRTDPSGYPKGEYWCVLHGHPKKEGSATDKAPGGIIKCYSVADMGEESAKAAAEKMHRAILMSQAREAGN